MRLQKVLLALAAVLLVSGCASAEASVTATTGGTAGTVCQANGTNQIVISGVDDVQMRNSQAVYQVAQGLPLSQQDKDQAATVGITVIWTESTAGAGYPYGGFNTGDVMNGVPTSSRGLFQQMTAWGSLEDRLDPVKSAGLFYNSDKGPGVTGLLHVPGWQQMTISMAGQTVEGSQFSDGSNYESHVSLAQNLVQALAGSVTCTAAAGAVSTGGGGVGMEMNQSQDPSSFGWVHAGAMEPLVFQGHNFGQVAAGTAKLWTAMLSVLVPQIPGGLNSDLGCFEDRANVNSPGQLSFHAYGLACDLNSGVNANGASPAFLQGQQYALPMTTGALVNPYGFIWGGEFNGTKDPMHIELHITPDQVATWTAAHP